MLFLKPLTGWIFILSGSVLLIPMVATFKRFFETHSFRNLAWSLAYFTLFSGLILLGISRIQNHPHFVLVGLVFIFFFVTATLWILSIWRIIWSNEQRVFSYLLVVAPWIFFATLPQNIDILIFAIWTAISLTILFATWLLSYIRSRLRILDMNMSLATLPLATGIWLLVFNQSTASYFIVSILMLSGVSLMTYTWVNYGQKTD